MTRHQSTPDAAPAARAAPPRRILFVLPTLELGGMQTRFLAAARALARRGGRATLVSGPGPLEGAAAEAGDLRLVDWAVPRAAGVGRAAEEARRHDAVVLSCAPELLHAAPVLALEAPLVLCIHNVPGTFAGWFRPALVERLPRLFRGLIGSGRAILTADSERKTSEHERELNLPAGSVQPWPNGVELPAGVGDAGDGPVRSVVLICRLAPEKLTHGRAAAALVAAGRAAGHDARLDLYGEGPAEEEMRRALEELLPPGAFELRGATHRPTDVLAGADASVGAGRALLESLAAGTRAITLRAGGLLGDPVTPGNFDELAADNFAWRGREPVAPAEAWRRLEAVGASDLARLRRRVETEFSSDAMLDRLIAVLGTLAARPLVDSELVHAAAGEAVALADELAEQTAVADSLWEARTPGRPA